MRKVVYNACFGGFSISEQAARRAREITENPNWAGVVLSGESYSDGSIAKAFGSMDSVYVSHLPRHDDVLVQVVEELGEAASGSLSALRIAQVEGPYRIDEYDGAETVETPNSYDWVY